MNNKPVAWMPIQSKHTRIVEAKPDDEQNWIPLYLHPVKELTDEEIKQLQRECISDAYAQAHFHGDKYINSQQAILNFARAILRKAQEK